MEIKKTKLEGLLIIKPKLFIDNRGFFFESYNQKLFETLGLPDNFVQDNQSISNKNVLRGLHYQKQPYAQGKLVSVFQGAVLDVVVDIRPNSLTYGQHFKQVLSSENKLMLWIPPDFAHGFLSLENNTVFFYKCTNYYHKESEAAILWNDPKLAIDWGTDCPNLSEKDAQAPLF